MEKDEQMRHVMNNDGPNRPTCPVCMVAVRKAGIPNICPPAVCVCGVVVGEQTTCL